MNKKGDSDTGLQPLGDSVLSVLAIIFVSGAIMLIIMGFLGPRTYYYSENNLEYMKQAIDKTPVLKERIIPVNIEPKTILAACDGCLCLCEGASCQDKELKRACFSGYEVQIMARNNNGASTGMIGSPEEFKSALKFVKTKQSSKSVILISNVV
jgi:hypothetical protein